VYKLALILRYFQRKLIAIFALLAVTLCTAMVIIVISVMGGFLDLMTSTAKNLSGDVIIQSDLTGFPHYDEMLDGLRRLPEVTGAAAIVRGFGLIKLHGSVRGVHISGIAPGEFNTVTNYRKTLNWTSGKYLKHLEELAARFGDGFEAGIEEQRRWFKQNDLVESSMRFENPRGEPGRPGLIPGIAVSRYNRRDDEGAYSLWEMSTGGTAVLTVIPITTTGTLNIEPAVDRFVVVNEFKSGFLELDANFVYVPFDVLQRMLGMDERQEADEETGLATGGIFPARTTEIMIRGSDSFNLEQIEGAVRRYVEGFVRDKDMEQMIDVKNWLEDRWGTILAAVQKEKMMMAFLFGVISLVSVVMVAVIFYMIVMEKTRDIGVLRAIGASRSGITVIFLGYALTVGLVGAALGLGLAYLVVQNLNEIQDLLAATVGFKMWDPKIYYFEKIPARVDLTEASIITACAVVASVMGAAIPALLAGRTDPVKSLRYE
jgi:lipoprotein-releasing system permease protein